MRREAWLRVLVPVSAGLLTVAIGLILIRWLAPGLIGSKAPVDLRLVQADDRVTPFFESALRASDIASAEFLLNDPHTRVRPRPLLAPRMTFGPHDLLGMRNDSVPVWTDVLAIGDSQTYGNNVPLAGTWPAAMRRALAEPSTRVYQMATGGWAAPQYLYMARRAPALLPQVMVVAYYAGNDPAESLRDVLEMPYWQGQFRSASNELAPLPRTVLNEGAPWPVRFAGGVETVFTPGVRLISNLAHPRVAAGWAVMLESAIRIAEIAVASGTTVVFALIPTKELVYAQRVADEGIAAPPQYRELVEREAQWADRFLADLSRIPGAQTVDVLAALRVAAAHNEPLYPDDDNGHPDLAGYRVIGEAIAAVVDPLLAPPPEGTYRVTNPDDDGGESRLVLIRDAQLWLFASSTIARDNGWDVSESTVVLADRWRNTLPRAGLIDRVDTARFGPRSD